MSNEELSGDYEGSTDDRTQAFYDELGISENAYPQIVADSLAHATENRPWAGAQEPWVPVGPRNLGGRIIAVAQHPTNPLILYAGSAHGGLWRTTDGGDTWTHVDDPASAARIANAPVGAIAIPDQEPDTLYVGTGMPQDYKASGTGLYRIRFRPPPQPVQFTRLAEAPPPFQPPRRATNGASWRYTRIRMDPDDPLRLWIASQTGLWRCELHNGGRRFHREFTEPAESGDAPPSLIDAEPASPLPDPFSWGSYCSDLLVTRDPRDRAMMGNRARYLIIHVGIAAQGVYRGRYDRSSGTTTWERRLDVPNANINTTPGVQRRFRRVAIALCERQPQHVYAVFANNPGRGNPEHNHASWVFHSSDNGDSWIQRNRIPRASGYGGNASGQANYDLVLEVNQDNPDVLICGEIDLCLSTDNARTWTQIMDWPRNYRGEHGEHGDQHGLIFDRFDRRKVWSGNDGGLSHADDIAATPGKPRFWRLRSHGIAAGQFQHITISTGHPSVSAGGLQDNGTWMTFGGPTWYHVGGGDGGGLAIDPTNPRRLYVSHQRFFKRLDVVSATASPNYHSPVVQDLPASVAPKNSIAITRTTMSNITRMNDGSAPFVPVLAQHPAQAGRLILGWAQLAAGAPPPPAASALAYSSTDGGGASTTPLVNSTPATLTAGNRRFVTAAIFGPQFTPGTNVDGWIGLSDGQLFVTDDAPTGAWATAPTALPGAPAGTSRGMVLSDVAVHPRDNRIVAVSVARTQGQVFISYDRGNNWQELTARVPDSIAVTPANPGVPQSQHRQMTAEATYANGDRLDVTARARWNSATPANAAFTALSGREGQITAVAVGTSAVTATLMGVTSPPQTVTVTATVAGAALNPTPRGDPDLRALPPSPVAAITFARTGASQWSLFAGTVAGVYQLPDIPTPETLTFLQEVGGAWTAIGPAANPEVDIPANQTRAIRVRCHFSDASDHDITRHVDWPTLPGASILQLGTTAATLGHITVKNGVPAGSRETFSIRRGAVTAQLTVHVAGPNPPATAPPAETRPTVAIAWRPFHNRLPLSHINDLQVIPGLTNVSILRAATYGRAIWDTQLHPARPAGRLFIRHTVIEDGRTYPRPAAFPIADDPRLVAGQAILDHTHAFDIRVDSSPFQFFDARVDGVEMDEDMAVDTLATLQPNAVYVQVHNSGRDPIQRVHVHLYFMLSLDNAAPPNPVTAPAGGPADAVPTGLRPVAEFYRPGNNYDPLPRPAGVAIGQRWQRVAARQEIGPLEPGQPVVARFDWTAPVELADQPVALLALCSGQDGDTLPNAPAGGPALAAFLLAERRAALRIVPAGPAPRSAVYIRDGVSDQGQPGHPATSRGVIGFPARSPDIIVPHPVPAGDAKIAFRDLLDPRPQDFLQAGEDNVIIVRVHNRGVRTTEAEIQLWAIAVGPDSAPAVGAAWTQIAANTPNNARRSVDPADWHWVRFHWQPGDPNPGEGYKAYLLVALVSTTDGQDTRPDRALATTVERLWQILGELADADNAAARALRVRPRP